MTFDQIPAHIVAFVSPADWLRNGDPMAFMDMHSQYPGTVPLLQVWTCLCIGRWDETLMNAPWPALAAALGLAFYGRRFRCHGKHGFVDLTSALQVSCDSYFYTMGKRLGIDAIAEVFNMLNHTNYGSFTLVETNANNGRPAENLNIAYQPRLFQFGFRATF